MSNTHSSNSTTEWWESETSKKSATKNSKRVCKPNPRYDYDGFDSEAHVPCKKQKTSSEPKSPLKSKPSIAASSDSNSTHTLLDQSTTSPHDSSFVVATELDESQTTQINKSLYTSQPPQTDPHSGGTVHDKAVVADVAPMSDLGFESNDHNTVDFSPSSTDHPLSLPRHGQ